VVQACRKFGVRCHLFKIVTDTPSHEKDADIIANIEATRGILFDYCCEKIGHPFVPQN
jgi:hypothetical protein